MQIAEILSDLTSLRVCDYDAALALVTAHKSLDAQSSTSSSTQSPSSAARPGLSRRTSVLEDGKEDPDLQRAMDLVDLHYGVKERHMQGADMGLQKARTDVQRAMEKLRGEKQRHGAGHRHRASMDPRLA
ncbi:hypothetical protein MMC30_000274 [Trapelia coarctata]|nr:hypothetical protein [Trapelia coarctata]